jgi:hypothetical protein
MEWLDVQLETWRQVRDLSAFIREAGFDVKAVKATHTIEPYGGITADGVRMAANDQKDGALYEREFKRMLTLFEGGTFKKAGEQYPDGSQKVKLNLLRADIEQGAKSGSYEYAGWHLQLLGTIEQLEILATMVDIPELPTFESVRSRPQPGMGSAHGKPLAKEKKYPTQTVGFADIFKDPEDSNRVIKAMRELKLVDPDGTFIAKGKNWQVAAIVNWLRDEGRIETHCLDEPSWGAFNGRLKSNIDTQMYRKKGETQRNSTKYRGCIKAFKVAYIKPE